MLGVAGSGKTTVLARRHAWLASEGGIAAEHVLALTHSALAVDELRAQRRGAARRAASPSCTCTAIHGFCARLLRDEADEAGLDPFVVTRDAPPTGSRCCSSASTS